MLGKESASLNLKAHALCHLVREVLKDLHEQGRSLDQEWPGFKVTK